MTAQIFAWLRRAAAPLVVLVAVACSEVPTVAPVDSEVASFARNRDKEPGTPDKNKSCDREAGNRAQAPKEKNECGPTGPVLSFKVAIPDDLLNSTAYGIGWYPASCPDLPIGVDFASYDGTVFTPVCAENGIVIITLPKGYDVSIGDVPCEGDDDDEGTRAWVCTVMSPEQTINVESEPPSGVPTSFAGFAFFYQSTVLDSTQCAQYGTRCQDAKTAADTNNDKVLRQIHIDVHTAYNFGGIVPTIPQAGFNPALISRVSFRSLADNTETLVVNTGAGFYYTSQYYWTVFIEKDPGFSPSTFYDPNYAFGDPLGTLGSHYVSVTYNGSVYNYLIITYN